MLSDTEPHKFQVSTAVVDIHECNVKSNKAKIQVANRAKLQSANSAESLNLQEDARISLPEAYRTMKRMHSNTEPHEILGSTAV